MLHFFLLRDDYNILLISQVESFLPYNPNHFVHEEGANLVTSLLAFCYII